MSKLASLERQNVVGRTEVALVEEQAWIQAPLVRVTNFVRIMN
jgi:hypothetical protein